MPVTTPLIPVRTSALADALLAEDHAEDTGCLDALDRMTCRAHRRWRRECAPARPMRNRLRDGLHW